MLDAKLAGLLPWLILVAQEDDLSANNGLNTLESSSLVLRAGTSCAVAVAAVGPARLENVNRLARANAVEDVDLTLDEAASLVGSHLGVEEGIQIGTENVNNAAQRRGVAGVFPNRQRLGGGNRTTVASTFESTGTTRNESSKFTGRAVAIEDSLIADHNELNEIPLSPSNNVGDLALGARDARRGDPDTKDDLESVVAGRAADVLEGAAVSAVDTDG